MKDFTNQNQYTNITLFNYVTGFEIAGLLYSPIILILILNIS